MKTVAAIDITVVTPEQIGRCSKCFSGKTAYYMVLSESDNLTEYQVKYSKEHGFTCSCPAGQAGFVHCKEGYCKHITWAVAAAAEEKAALAELRQAAEQEAAKAQPIEQRWGLPAWMLTGPVASHMKLAPHER